MKSATVDQKPDGFLEKDEACRRLNVSLSTLERLVKKARRHGLLLQEVRVRHKGQRPNVAFSEADLMRLAGEARIIRPQRRPGHAQIAPVAEDAITGIIRRLQAMELKLDSLQAVAEVLRDAKISSGTDPEDVVAMHLASWLHSRFARRHQMRQEAPDVTSSDTER
jgi:hypothetical protein